MSSKGDRSRESILQNALELFAAKGFSAVTMQEVCNGTKASIPEYENAVVPPSGSYIL